jgi:ribonuclease D
LSYITVAHPHELTALIRHIGDSPWIALDTEFIAEKKYQSQLCLVQIAAEGILAIIDPQTIENLNPFWEFLCSPEREVLVHACRSEMEFCYRAIGRAPEKVFDVQLAAGFVGEEYPSSFGALLSRYLQITIPKAETRTDWAKRPLSPRQIDYALNDVRYLNPLTKRLKKKLAELQRTSWYQNEIRDILARLMQNFQTPRWRTLPGVNNLSRRELAIVRELWFWRDAATRKCNIAPGLLLRDDLIFELARRKSSDLTRISAIRGMQRKDIMRRLPEISAAILAGLECDESELPEPIVRPKTKSYSQMALLLYSGLTMLCHQNGVAVNVVATQSDVHDMIASRFGIQNSPTPLKLTHGWRATIVGRFMDDLLNGNIAICIDKRNPEEPLQFVRLDESYVSLNNRFQLE